MTIKRGGGRPEAYKNEAGERLPSVTTVLSRYKEAGGLIHWAWELGMEGKNYRDERDKAANVGTVVHDMVEAFIHGDSVELVLEKAELEGADADKAGVSFDAFKRWATLISFTPLVTEIPLVSERMQTGGTLDLVAGTSLGTCVVDWKAANKVYPEYLVQGATYSAIWDEARPEEFEANEIDGGFILCRFGKESGGFHLHHWPMPALRKPWQHFCTLRRAYAEYKDVKAML